MHKPVEIVLADCIFDEDNPNEMSDEQEASLGVSLHEFGYLGDLIVVEPKNKKGKHFVHHGEHRIKKLMDEGVTKAWGFVQKMNALQHRAYRQAMNKLKGTHDPEKDKIELAFFAKQHKLEFLSSLIAQPKEQLIIEEKPEITVDKPMIEHYHDTFLDGNLKQIHLIFKNADYEKFLPKAQTVMKKLNVDNHTDMVVKLVTNFIKDKKIK